MRSISVSYFVATKYLNMINKLTIASKPNVGSNFEKYTLIFAEITAPGAPNKDITFENSSFERLSITIQNAAQLPKKITLFLFFVTRG